MKALLIDDDDDVRFIAGMSLSHVGGMTVIQAANGAEGARKALDENPDVILLDMMMPLMDGVQTLAELRAHSATAVIPVIFLTAKTFPADIDRMLDLGVAGVLTKPFNPQTLAEEVRLLVQESVAQAGAAPTARVHSI